ncbi:MAG: hypothetical protein AB7G47_22660 [Mycolicibacterium sp.]|uniref:hypothetical protein n=1 Tax=Mycolicibacterium sp. TaxID=2320850 RepID=UPI003D106DBA
MRRWALAVVLTAITAAVACSPSNERPSEKTTTTERPQETTTTTPDTTQPTTTPAETGTGHGSLANCLREHGVPPAPGPTTGLPPGVDPAVWQQALAECSSLVPGPPGQ